MTVFLTFLGMIALFVICKFIYDSYLTSNTEKNWEKYKNNNPESAARIERNKGLNLNTKSKSRENDKRDSLLRMASNGGCSPAQVKENYFKFLREEQMSAAALKEVIEMAKQKKYEESKVFKIDPDDTGAAYFEEWAKEYYGDLILENIIPKTQEQEIVNNEAEKLNKQGGDEFSNKNYEDSIKSFSEAIVIQPNYIYFHNRADSYYKFGQKEKAKSDYHSVIAINPSDNERNIYSKLASIYLDEKDFKTALIYYNKAISLSPERKITLYNRAVVHINLDDNISAINDLKELLEARPNDVASYFLLVDLYFEQQEFDNAKKCMDDVELLVLMEPEFNLDDNQFAKLTSQQWKYNDWKNNINDDDLPF